MSTPSTSPEEVTINNDELDSSPIYQQPSLTNIEDVEDYLPGGLHPVHLGDHLGAAQRYRVLHKLGSGAFAVVWLCRDTVLARFVSVKIVRADESHEQCAELEVARAVAAAGDEGNGDVQGLAGLLDVFWIQGPNGRHLCLVHEVYGPRLDQPCLALSDRSRTLMAYSCARGLALLHKLGYCHGDFRPANILIKLTGLNDLSEDELSCLLDEPQIEPLWLESGDFPASQASQYVVAPLDYDKIISLWYDAQEAVIIDFGLSFHISNPPADLTIPNAYTSPELFFDKKAGVASDIWALACTVFEIRTGQPLFHDAGQDEDDIIMQWIRLLGPLPESWLDQGNGRNLLSGKASALHKITLRDYLSYTAPSEDRLVNNSRETRIDSVEAAALEDLLFSMLHYDPTKRITVEEILNHKYWQCLPNST